MKASYALSALIIAMPALQAMEEGYKIKEFVAQREMGDIELFKDHEGFKVLRDGEYTPIKHYDIDSILSKMDDEQLEKFQEVGYLALKKCGTDYKLMAKTRGPGGGPVLGWFLYGLTKTTMYAVGALGIGAGVAASTGAIVATGGMAAPVVTGGGAIVGLAASTVPLTVAASTAPAIVVASTLAATPAFVTGSTALAGGTLAATGCSVGLIAGFIEACSLAAGAAGTACVWLP